MGRKIKLASIILAITLAFSMATACVPKIDSGPTPTVSAPPAETNTQTEMPGTQTEPPQAPTGNSIYDADTLMLTVNGAPVYWEEFKYWMYSSLQYISQYMGFDLSQSVDWTLDVMGTPLRDLVIDDIKQSVAMYRIVEEKCEELGITLTEQDLAALDSIYAENSSYFGGADEYNKYLEENYLTDGLVRYLLEVSYRYSNLFNELYGAEGEKCTDEEVIAYGNESGYLRAKHILLKSFDENDEPLSDEIITANLETLSGLLEQLGASDDPAALFDSLMHEYSQDTNGLQGYPDGYQFVSGDMVPQFEEAVRELEDYSYSGIVDMPIYGYTIIMRLPLEPDDTAISESSGRSLRYIAATMNFQTVIQSWTDEAVIEYADAYNSFKPEDWF